MTAPHKAPPPLSRLPPCPHCSNRLVRRRDINDVYLQCSTCGRFPESPRVETEFEAQHIPHQDPPYRHEYLNDRIPFPAQPASKDDPTSTQDDKEIPLPPQTSTGDHAALPLPEDIHSMANELVIALTERIRWPDGLRCPHCNGEHVKAQTRYLPQPYRCYDCKVYYSHRQRSFIRHNMNARQWLAAISATIQVQRPLTFDEFLDATRRKSSKSTAEAHDLYRKAAALIDLDPDRAPSPSQATSFLNISDDLVPQEPRSKPADSPAKAGADTGLVSADSESPDSEHAGSAAPQSDPSETEPPAGAHAPPSDPTSTDPEDRRQQPPAGGETPPNPQESQRTRDLTSLRPSNLSPLPPRRTYSRRAAKPEPAAKADPADADAGIFSHDSDPPHETERAETAEPPQPTDATVSPAEPPQPTDATVSPAEPPHPTGTAMLPGLAATILGLSREQLLQLDAILDVALSPALTQHAATSPAPHPEPEVATPAQPAPPEPVAASTTDVSSQALPAQEQPVAASQPAQSVPAPVLSARRPVGVRAHSFGPHHA